MDVPASMAAQSAIGKQNMVLSTMKHSADQAQLIANIIEKSVLSAPVNQSRGTNINIKA